MTPKETIFKALNLIIELSNTGNIKNNSKLIRRMAEISLNELNKI